MYLFTIYTLLVVSWCDCMFATVVNFTGASAAPAATSAAALPLRRVVIPLATPQVAVM